MYSTWMASARTMGAETSPSARLRAASNSWFPEVDLGGEVELLVADGFPDVPGLPLREERRGRRAVLEAQGSAAAAGRRGGSSPDRKDQVAHAS
jgi:hypothetical protein